ncbi:MAG: type II toxin-antitoxin system PemK/MazF family toxin [Marinilabiliales bacterium]|nr:type II toxin-antitoxin system PemK/MazF family toxin [Marinilabiliales bacterium]
MVILQGDVFWFDLGRPRGSALRFPAAPCRRPERRLQQPAAFSTTGLMLPSPRISDRAKAPGTSFFRRAKRTLLRPSVVNVSQVVTVDKSLLREKIGTLSRSEDPGDRSPASSLVFRPRELP